MNSTLVLLLIFIVSCGNVTEVSPTADAQATEATPADTDSDSVMMKGDRIGITLDVGSGGTTGAGTMDGRIDNDGSGGTSGSGGAPSRPLTAGCTQDEQCMSGFCAKAAGATSGSCCTGHPDICNTYIAGYLTPIMDGHACDTGGVCSGENAWQGHKCIGGACMLYTVQCPRGCVSGYCR